MNPMYQNMTVVELSKAVGQGDREACIELGCRTAGTVNAMANYSIQDLDDGRAILVEIPNISPAKGSNWLPPHKHRSIEKAHED